MADIKNRQKVILLTLSVNKSSLISFPERERGGGGGGGGGGKVEQVIKFAESAIKRSCGQQETGHWIESLQNSLLSLLY